MAKSRLHKAKWMNPEEINEQMDQPTDPIAEKIENTEEAAPVVEIVKIVESNDTKILSTSIKTKPDSAIIEVTLKLNRINIEAVLQTFNRFHYEIKEYYGENVHDEDLLRDRYNSLMTYLNI